jgi:hypothetical protein
MQNKIVKNKLLTFGKEVSLFWKNGNKLKLFFIYLFYYIEKKINKFIIRGYLNKNTIKLFIIKIEILK